MNFSFGIFEFRFFCVCKRKKAMKIIEDTSRALAKRFLDDEKNYVLEQIAVGERQSIINIISNR